MNDAKLVSKIQERIECCDFENLFASGECFRFALRLHERWSYKIRGIRYSVDSNWRHVWALRDAEKGIDIRGIHCECLLAALANDGRAAKVEDVDVEHIRALVRGKEYSSELSATLDDLADKIINTHIRFMDAKPDNKKKTAALLKNLQNTANQISEPSP